MLRPSDFSSRNDNGGLRRNIPFAQDRFFSSSSFFGPDDPFDDPFFKEPLQSFFSSHHDFFQPFTTQKRRPSASSGNHAWEESISSKGPVIEELSSSDEEDEVPKTHVSKASREPIVEHPDDDFNNSLSHSRPVFGNREWPRNNTVQSYSFSSVTYGGPGGTYYKSSTTRRTGPDGLIEEAHEESDSRTGHEVNQIMRGLGNKGHAVTRNRDTASGHENFVETLHNVTEDEKSEFDKAWRQHAEKWSWNHSSSMLEHGNRGKGKSERRALPSLPPSSSPSSSSSVAKASPTSTKDSGWKWPWGKKN